MRTTESMRIGWLTSGRGEGSRNLLTAVQKAILEGSLNAKNQYVLCVGEEQRQQKFKRHAVLLGAPVISVQRRYLRETLTRVVGDAPADVIVFAGLADIIPLDVLSGTPAINIHPALPDGPTGWWQDVASELLAQNALYSGVTVHWVTDVVDRGEVIEYERFPIPDNFDGIRQAMLENEPSVLVKALKHLVTLRSK